MDETDAQSSEALSAVEAEQTDPRAASNGQEAAETTVQALPFREPQEPESEPVPVPSYAISWAQLWRLAVGVGLLFGLAAVFLALRQVATETMAHIVVPRDVSHLQEITDGVPLPRLLDWSPVFLEVMLLIRDMNPVLGTLGAMLVLSILAPVAIGVLNPTFRLFERIPLIPKAHPTPAPPLEAEKPEAEKPEKEWSEQEIREQDMPEAEGAETESRATGETTEARSEALAPESYISQHAEHIRQAPIPSVVIINMTALWKAIQALAMVGIPLAVMWIAAGRLPTKYEEATRAIRMIAVGLSLWIGFHRSGVGDDFTRHAFRWKPHLVPRLLAAGIAFGLCFYALRRWALPASMIPILDDYHTLGTFNTNSWKEVAGSYLGCMAGVGFATGTLLLALGRPGLNKAQRLVVFLLPALAVLCGALVQRRFTPQALAQRLDLTPQVRKGIEFPYEPLLPGSGIPTGPEAVQEFSRLAQLPPPLPEKPRVRNAVLLDTQSWWLLQRTRTDDGFLPDPEVLQRIQDFLEKRHYQSALSWMAMRNLFHAATIEFNTGRALQIAMRDTLYCPHMARAGDAMRDMLFLCATTPDNRKVLDQLADERLFSFPDRESKRMMGDLYRRFGLPEQAVAWYRKAEMPQSFLEARRTERPMFHNGQVKGILRLNGKPLAGVTVGVLPRRLNGLPHDLELRLLSAKDEMLLRTERAQATRSAAFRWISAGATTDANGAFSIRDLTEGEYILVCTLASTSQPRVLDPNKIRIDHSPSHFVVNYTQPVEDAGIVEFTTTGK